MKVKSDLVNSNQHGLKVKKITNSADAFKFNKIINSFKPALAALKKCIPIKFNHKLDKLLSQINSKRTCFMFYSSVFFTP